MDLSDASEKIPSETTGDRSRDLPTTLPHSVANREVVKLLSEILL